MKKQIFILAILFSSTFKLLGQNVYEIDATKPGISVSPRLYGIFFEEINHSGEGGLYSEMVFNRDFEMTNIPEGSKMAGNLVRTKNDWQERKIFGNELYGWTFLSKGGAIGDIRLQTIKPLNEKNPSSMRLIVTKTGSRSGVYNSGYWGMNLKKDETYNLSFYARTNNSKKLDVTVSLESPNGNQIYAKKKILNIGGDWHKYQCFLVPNLSDNLGRLSLTINQADTIWLDVVSLFPQKTYKNRPNGLRPDMVQMLIDLKPSFVRFPGGAIVGGMNLDNRIQWKNSIGDISQRKGTMNLWGYYTTNGLGFHEYLQLCEDIKADALWVCNPGFSDNYRKAEYCKPEDVKLYIQEALDALEYALGPVNSEWGSKRAANGHPAPFHLKYIEIGNEASGQLYNENYKQFYSDIKTRYPNLKIICNQRAIPNGKVEIKDDHKYGTPQSFISAFNKYDTTDRKGPEIYVGEYACSRGVGEGNLLAALSDAVFLMGLEKNSDIVTMSSYAPLFFHVSDKAWPVNMIGFDNSKVFGRTSYYVNKMMAENRPDFMLDTRSGTIEDHKSKKWFSISGYDQKTDEVIIKVVNIDSLPQKASFCFRGIKLTGQPAEITELSHKDCNAENSLYNPNVIVPKKNGFTVFNSGFEKEFPPFSFSIIRIKVTKPNYIKATLKDNSHRK
ncbi:MAG: alpha-L-arabinofuranosidase C-terminal domain-containing protein [Bacteroidota bacterium]|nr:alpha-L-arabinofuranosidase C-terminal domain-containing protein [Bacteroidota bacterium]